MSQLAAHAVLDLGNPVMKNGFMASSKLYFLYANGKGWTCREVENPAEAESHVRYWLGKSPGIHEMEEILFVHADEHRSFLYVVEQMAEEERKFREEMREREEHETYERLKKKFG